MDFCRGERKVPVTLEGFLRGVVQPKGIPCEAFNIPLTGGGKVFHRIQKADRLNNASLPKIMTPSGTVRTKVQRWINRGRRVSRGRRHTRNQSSYSEGYNQGGHQYLVCRRVEDRAKDRTHIVSSRQVAVELNPRKYETNGQFQAWCSVICIRTRSVRPAYTSNPVATRKLSIKMA